MAGKPAGAVSARPGSGDGVAEPCERHPAHWARPCPPPPHRLIFVTNHLPLKVTKDEVSGWSFERDEDALVLQAKGGLPDDMEALYVGCLPVEIEGHEQEVGAAWAACWGCSAGHEEQRAVHRAAASDDHRPLHTHMLAAGGDAAADDRLQLLPGVPGGGAEEQLLQE